MAARFHECERIKRGTTTTESYTYDAVGNRLSALTVPQFSYNSSNELMSTSLATFAYDGNGNTVSKTVSSGTTQYGWDFENRLSSAVMPGSGGTVTFQYDPLGRRIQKAFTQGTTTTTTNYLYDGASDVEEVDQNGNVIARYTQGAGIDEPLAEFRSSTASFYEQDGMGSVTSLSGSTGALVNTYVYKAFGNLASSSGSTVNPFQYAGRDYDSETGLRYYRARYYDANTGRFLSEDPIRFQAGTNFYQYVQNSPLNWIDPSGDAKHCYEVTSKGMEEVSCVDPNSGVSCIYVPGGMHCKMPVPSGPPRKPLYPNPHACPCGQDYLDEQGRRILDEETNELNEILPHAVGATTGLFILEQILHEFGAKGVAEWIPLLDLALLANDIREVIEIGNETQEKLDQLFAPCLHNTSK